MNSDRRDFFRRAGSWGAASLALPGASHAASAMTASPLPAGHAWNVRDYGARGDGHSLDTAAINRAIAAAAKAGGGRVYFPAGSYLSYSIHLQSRITLHLGEGAVLIAADSPPAGQPGGFDLPEPNPAAKHYEDFGHRHWHNSLIWGVGLQDVAILGPGLIWGLGLSKGYGPGPNARQPGVGNKSIALKNCHNVLLRDFQILHGGHFGILATGVDNLTIDNLKIDTNRDGMDIDCCRNVRIVNTSVNSPWDDGICLKSSYALGFPRPTEWVTIANCFVSGGFMEGTLLDGTFRPFPSGQRAFHTGRIKCGTESTGGFMNIAISNCIFENCQGLALETVDGAHLEDITVTNLTMRNISSAPLYLRLGRRMRAPAGTQIGRLRRVTISNVSCHGADPRLCSIISGIPGHLIEDVRLNDILIEHRGDPVTADAHRQPPERQRGYPGPGRTGPMPAHGFFIRHARGVSMSNIEVRARGNDARATFVLNDVENAAFFHIQATPARPAFRLRAVRRFQLAQSWPWPEHRIMDAKKEEIAG